jgi:hypothetical protein
LIGPLLRSPRRGPRSIPLAPDRVRRARNRITDLAELAMAPFARWERERLVEERPAFHVRGLDPVFDGYRVAFLTDLHLSPLVPAWWLARAVERTVAWGADLIALGGDFIDDDPHYVSGLAAILQPLRAPDGVVAVLGNHDHYVDAAGVRGQLALAGVRELYNTPLLVRRGIATLAVTGVGDLQCDAIDFTAACAGVPANVPRLVLSHDPDVFAYWPREVRMDLMLSGHTHGGQAWLPLLGPPFVPSQFGFRYLQGWHREGERQLYVSRGVGASGVPFRWKCPPELTLATLHPAPP